MMPREAPEAVRGVERKLRITYRYVARSREVTRRVGALAATFPVRDARSLRYYGRRFADFEPDRAWIADALARVDETDTFWDAGARWGAYTAYLGQVCDRTVTVTTRPSHLRRVVAANGVDGGVVRSSDGSWDGRTVDLSGRAIVSRESVPAPTVVRVGGGGIDAVGETVRLVYVTPTGEADRTSDAAVTDRLRSDGFDVTRLPDGAVRGSRSVSAREE